MFAERRLRLLLAEEGYRARFRRDHPVVLNTTCLSLLHDLPNYRHSLPTKVVEYMAHGIPVITTPVPPTAAIVTESGCGLVVPYEDPTAAAEGIPRLRDGQTLRREMAERGHETAYRRFHWPHHGNAFVAQLNEWIDGTRQRSESLVDEQAGRKRT